MAPKVMMIGLDAASIEFILAALPSLPNLRRAIESGVLRRLRSRTSERKDSRLSWSGTARAALRQRRRCPRCEADGVRTAVHAGLTDSWRSGRSSQVSDALRARSVV